MKKRIASWALVTISAALALLSIVVFNAADELAGAAEEKPVPAALWRARGDKLMILALLFGALAAAIGYFQRRGGRSEYR